MRRPLPLCLSIAVLFVFWMAALPAAASTLAVDVVEDDLTPQPLVLALKPGPSGQVFSAVEAIEPTPEALMEDTFTLVFPRRPEALESLKEGWRLVAASDRNAPSTDTPAARLFRHGIMARVISITERDDRWALELEHVGLEEIIESGTLTLSAMIHMTSADEGFPDTSLYTEDRHLPEWHWLEANFHAREAGADCLPGDLTADLQTTIPLPPLARIQARYLGTLAMERSWKFHQGELKAARLEGYVCQASQLTLSVGEALNEVVPLWQRTYGPSFHFVGGLPLMLEVKGKLGLRLAASSELTLHDPLRLHHETTGAMVLKDEDWQWASPPSQNSMRLPAPSLQVDSRIDVGLGLLPRLELVLYAMAGPYLQAEASRELSWRHSAPLEESAGLTLTGGITHRAGRWGDWEDTELVPPYRWPEAESNDE